MDGINLNKPIVYKYASLRFFNPKEKYVTRFCEDEVLMLVFDGILRFTENEVAYEVHPGEYHIHKGHTFQRGDVVSDAPKYLYVHFTADWGTGDTTLPRSGTFDYRTLKPLIEKLDRLSHDKALLTEQITVFFTLLSELFQNRQDALPVDEMAAFLSQESIHSVSLDELCRKFHFSKNHVINLFKERYGVTPIEYVNRLKIRRAEYLLEVTSDSVEWVAAQCGFNSYSHFYRLFYRKNGVSPRKWRSETHVQPLR